ncbi:MAG: PhnD/SsuA/transferrin family substrate-binding protein [Polaromonas sp.]
MKRRTWLHQSAWLAADTLGLAQAKTSPIAVASPVAAGLRIGLTAVILADQAAFLSRWAAYLSERMGQSVSFVVRESYQSILDLLFAGQLDAAWICGYPYVREHARLQLLAVPLYQGVPTYQSYLIRNLKGAEKIQGWADLKQRVLAYSDPLSNSGWLVPQVQLRSAGVRRQDLRRSFFAHSHRNVAEAVATRLADAGCIDGYVWETMRLQKMAVVVNTEVIWKSEAYGFPPLVIRAGEDTLATRRLGDVLLAMRRDNVAQALLEALNLTGFINASPVMFDSIKKLALSIAPASR